MSIGGIDGLISGMSTTDLVTKIMSAERSRVTKMQQQKQDWQLRSDALKDIGTRLSSLQSSLSALNLRATMVGRQATTNTPPNQNPAVAVSAAADAALGSFTIRVDRLATSSAARGTGVAGTAIDSTAKLNVANGSIPVTNGAFTINGAQFTVDVAAQSLDDVVAAINGQSGTTGVTAALVADADGRAGNLLQLSSGGAISLGSAGDTSNFLSAMRVLGVPQAGGAITGQAAIGGVKAGALLSAASTATAIAGAGSFKINGVDIAYDAGVDTLNDVVGRINASKAGVTASFDTIQDRLVLTNNQSGNLGVALSDTTGNFLAAFKLVGAGDPVALGQTARYSLDGGATWKYSVSNTVTDAVPGVSITLKETSATDTTVTVGANADAAVGAIKGFVNAFNNAVQLIYDKTATKDASGKAAVLAYDTSIRGIGDSLRSMVSSPALGLSGAYTTFQSLGITTGAVGSAVGTTTTLTVDETKLRAALGSNPNAVFDLFSASSQVALTMPGDVAAVTGKPTSKLSGVYAITSDGAGTLSGAFTPAGGVAQALTGGGAITASGINTTLIPGLTLTGASSFTGAATTITVTARSGIATSLADYVKGLTASGGTLDGRQTSISSQQRDLDDRIRTMQDRLDQKEKSLYAQFSRMEIALAKMQEQSSQLSSGLAGLSSSSGG